MSCSILVTSGKKTKQKPKTNKKHYLILANPEKERRICLALPLNLRFYRESCHASETVLWKNISKKVL